MRSFFSHLALFLILFVGGRGVICSAAENRLHFFAEKTTYTFTDNEPVIVEFGIENKSSQDIEITFGYPDFLGLSFSSKNENAKPQIDNVLKDFNGSTPTLSLGKGKIFRFKVALNRYLKFSSAGRYDLAAVFEASNARTNENYRGAEKLEIKIEDSVMTTQLKEFYKLLETKNKSDIRSGLEPLLFWNHTRVIPALVDSLSVDANTAPIFGEEVAGALEKFLGCNDGQQALFEIMVVSFSAQSKGYELCAKHKLLPPLKLIEDGLQKEITRFRTLEFIRDFGNAAHVPLVTPFAASTNPQINALANEALRKIRAQDKKP